MAILKLLSHLDLAKNELQNAVLQVLGTAPSAPNQGQIYFDSAASNNNVYLYGDIGSGNAWNALAWAADLTSHTGDSSIHFTVASIDHGSIAGLGDDDHTQYALLAGRAGGQTLRGGTLASQNLILGSTANATKGYIELEDTVRLTTATTGAATDAFVMRNSAAGEIKIITPSGTPGAGKFLDGTFTWTTPAGGFTSFTAGGDSGADQTVDSGDLLEVTTGAGLTSTISKATTTVTIQVTVDGNGIVNSMLAQMAANTVKGNDTASLANATDIALSTNEVLGRLAGNIVGISVINDTSMAAASSSNITTAGAVKTYIDNLLGANDAMTFLGGLDASGANQLPTGDAGDTYKITVAGNFNSTTEQLEIGDTIICTTDSTAANTPANWIYLQDNLEAASETVKGFVEEATDAEVAAGTATGGTGAKLFVTPAKLQTELAKYGYKYTALIGDGASTSIAVNHALGNQHVLTQIFDASTGAVYLTEVDNTDANNVTVKFNTAPASNSIRVVVHG